MLEAVLELCKTITNKHACTDEHCTLHTCDIEEVTSVSDCNLESFNAPSVPELQAFIHVRKFKTSRTESWKWPNKLKIENALNNEFCLILVVYNLRNDPILLDNIIME